MAIFHLSMTIAKRQGGKRSLIAMAAYRSGEKLYSELYEKTSFYNHRLIQPDAFIMKPDNVPDEFLDRETLWNKMELSEKSVNAQLCREMNIALPVELDPTDQKELVQEFIKDNFVSQGMIADCAIHRDDLNNPHAHIMLTMREVDSEGNILNKSKRIPKLDENGEQLYNEKGQRVTISVKTNDWDRKSFVKEIRADWAFKVNQKLQERNIDQQISEKSFQELGKKEMPSIHEGYYSKILEEQGITSELRQKNLEIQNFNETIQELEKLEVEKDILTEDPNFSIKFEKTFSPLEKKELKNLASELKIFIDDKNVTKRLGELKRWENSLLFNNKTELQQQRLLLNKITDERENLKQAEKLLDKQAQRFFKKAYPILNPEKFTNQDIRTIVNETIYRKEILPTDALKSLIYEQKVIDLENEKKVFKEKPFQTERFIEKKMDQTSQAIEHTQDPQQKEVLEEKYQKLETLKAGLKDYVLAEVETRFGQEVAIDSVIEGELLLAKADYYQTTDFAKVDDQPRFTALEINRMLEASDGYLGNIQAPKIPNDCQGIYFIQESMQEKEHLTPLAKTNLQKIVNKNQYLPNSDKQEIKKELELTNKQEVKREPAPTIKMFKLAKLVSRLLQSPEKKKQRDLQKLIKLTKAEDERRPGRNIPLR